MYFCVYTEDLLFLLLVSLVSSLSSVVSLWCIIDVDGGMVKCLHTISIYFSMYAFLGLPRFRSVKETRRRDGTEAIAG